MFRKLPLLVFSLLLAVSAGLAPADAHNGVNHGSAKHQKVAGIDVLLELHSLAHYQSQFGTPAGLQGSHILTVQLLQGKQSLRNAQIKAKLVGPGKKLIGPESGQPLSLKSVKNGRQHYATAYKLSQKGTYAVMVMFKTGGKVSQAAFNVVVP